MAGSSLSLAGRVALVTGASGGLGRATAPELAQAGAHVIVTARSTRTHSTQPGLPDSTIEATAEQVQTAGGQATALRCDHTQEAEVERLMQHIGTHFGRLDLLVNNAWGNHDPVDETQRGREVWEEPLAQLRNDLLAGAYSDYITSLLALRHRLIGSGGLMVSTTWHTDEPPGWLPYEVSKAAKNRLVYALGHHLRGLGVTVLGVAPGWMRTELMLQHHTEDELRGQTETPHYAARAIVSLAADPQRDHWTGQILDVGDLADRYGFTDLDGTQPHWYRRRQATRQATEKD
ncbi:SDR family NAD(P)-dependent oxidoreductase [Deinococcus sonorensis]|uniref:SDR family NAD(P)-dependent oxidoreductase n=2 Tax=Deinococcus sonorensis TaxID=309891 RepID=A0AAU7U7Y1_9DEIO